MIIIHGNRVSNVRVEMIYKTHMCWLLFILNEDFSSTGAKNAFPCIRNSQNVSRILAGILLINEPVRYAYQKILSCRIDCTRTFRTQYEVLIKHSKVCISKPTSGTVEEHGLPLLNCLWGRIIHPVSSCALKPKSPGSIVILLHFIFVLMLRCSCFPVLDPWSMAAT